VEPDSANVGSLAALAEIAGRLDPDRDVVSAMRWVLACQRQQVMAFMRPAEMLGHRGVVLEHVRELAALFAAKLTCRCGRADVGGDGSCARCLQDEEDLKSALDIPPRRRPK